MNSIGGERRKHQRVTAEVLIKYQSADQFFTDYMQNISSGGIFVPTDDPLPLDTRLLITFSLPDCEQPITTEGIVIRSIHADPDSGVDPSGMGIQFQALSEDNLRLIDVYVESLL